MNWRITSGSIPVATDVLAVNDIKRASGCGVVTSVAKQSFTVAKHNFSKK